MVAMLILSTNRIDCFRSGDYLVSVKFNDQHIPDSPFKVSIAPSSGDIRKLNIRDLEQGLQVDDDDDDGADDNGDDDDGDDDRDHYYDVSVFVMTPLHGE